jgi:hypothetical protein
MGNKNSKSEEPKKSEEEIMRERWMKLADNSTKITPSEKNITNDLVEQVVNIPSQEKTNNEIRFDYKTNTSPPEDLKDITIDKSIPSEDKIPSNINSLNRVESIQTNSISESVKKIDKEHSTIEKVFRVSLVPSEKFVHLNLYSAGLLSEEKELAFRLSDLDNILLAIISETERKKEMIAYLLETYHRAIEMIERRYRNEFDEKYDQIRKIIASYLALIIQAPENFDIQIDPLQISVSLTKYYNECDEEELGFLLTDIILSTSADFNSMKTCVNYFFNIFHLDNMSSKPNFFNCERLKRNLRIIIKLMNDFPSTREVYISSPSFLPKGINGKSFQTSTYLGVYLNLVSFESDPLTLRNNFSSLNQNESDSQVRIQSNKLNNLMGDLSQLIYLLYSHDKTKQIVLEYFFDLIGANLDKLKMWANPFTTASQGFLMNSVIVLLKLFLDYEMGEYTSISAGTWGDNLYEIVNKIDILYCLSNKELNFSKYEMINASVGKPIYVQENEKQNLRCFNPCSKLFFLVHNLLTLFMKNLDEEYTRTANSLSEMFKMNMINDPKFRELFSMVRAFDVYLRSPEFNKNLMRFLQLTIVLIFSLNNKKYPYGSLKTVNYSEFLQSLYDQLEFENVSNLSILPEFIVKNILLSSLLMRKFSSEALLNNMEITQVLVYFALVYSSQTEALQNPHLRSEIFDILLYFFISNSNERNAKQNQALLKLLNNDYVQQKLIFALMRVFIDAERLGTSNQFYEKFSVRNKILLLIENILKSHRGIYSGKIVDYANEHKFDCTKMLSLLMNDVAFLIDEVIERLTVIKKYQDLKSDVEKFNSLDEETKQMENEKFSENDRLVKTELKVS